MSIIDLASIRALRPALSRPLDKEGEDEQRGNYYQRHSRLSQRTPTGVGQVLSVLPSPFSTTSKSQTRMVPDLVHINGRRLRYAISQNALDMGSKGLWAVNLHGYLAGGGMYWRESSKLASMLGWKVINPSLPGFGGSDAMPWGELSMSGLAKDVAYLLDELDVAHAIVLGHSMGGAVAAQFAYEFPDRTLGLIYRDGAATPEWRRRTGPIVNLLAPILPDIAALSDLILAALLDVPDLVAGRLTSTIKSVLPDAQRNVRSLGRTVPVGAMLISTDMREEILALRDKGELPILAEWGCADHIATPATAAEFSAHSGAPIIWVPGGHSWMLARPSTQAHVLLHDERGKAFLARVQERAQQLGEACC